MINIGIRLTGLFHPINIPTGISSNKEMTSPFKAGDSFRLDVDMINPATTQ
ncbi:hypothetical protein [Methanolobus psychrotolerans]|uniref:hypothetical protein n=1 Tax=Methanolobus psychrotolerans TaxID=1874706 RepID=UPI0013EC5C14|nr:hypothetical protein [Methanolobus psychrotolerans]